MLPNIAKISVSPSINKSNINHKK